MARPSDGDSGRPALSVTSTYLRGIDNLKIIAGVHARHAPMIPPATGLALHARSR